MAFVDTINEKIITKIELKCRNKKTGKIYPVRKIDFTDKYGDNVCYSTEEEQIKEHRAKGGHYCDSCGHVFDDEHFSFEEIDLILEKVEVK